MVTAATTNQRSYGQGCNIARTLDLVGERWTLLLVRELLTGPRSYGQLEQALPGIGTNLLATRLKRLESDGLIEREKVPGMRKRLMYRVTERGQMLEPVLVEMARFGAMADLDRGPDDYARPAWAVLSSKASFNADLAAGLNERYEFQVDDEVFYLGVSDGVPDNGYGPAGEPVVTARMDSGTFNRIQAGTMKMAQGVWTEEIEIIDGPAAALDRCEQIFGM